jgi:hypothetical protein
MGIAFAYFGSYLPHANLWNVPSFFNFVTLFMTLRTYRMNDLHALAVAGRSLANSFKVRNEEALLFFL